jgi:uncharacterized protein
MRGTVYTETVVHAAPAQLASEAPYQIAIVDLESGVRITGRVASGRVRIGDRVEMCEEQDGIPRFRLISSDSGK